MTSPYTHRLTHRNASMAVVVRTLHIAHARERLDPRRLPPVGGLPNSGSSHALPIIRHSELVVAVLTPADVEHVPCELPVGMSGKVLAHKMVEGVAVELDGEGGPSQMLKRPLAVEGGRRRRQIGRWRMWSASGPAAM